MVSRTANSIKNTTVSLIAQVLSVVLNFLTRTIFIKLLGAEYLGINGLFTSILSMLSFAEFGVGTAIIYALYKPIAENDEKRISGLMNLYAKAYKIIGIIIGVVGIAITPFLGFFIKDKPNISNVPLIYIMFLTNSVISYFYAYKRSILIASQNAYINVINQVYYFIIQNLIQIVVLLFYPQYILFLLIQIVITFASNIAISRKVDKMFPYLKFYKYEVIDRSTKRQIKKNIVGTMSSKIGGIIVTGTDNMLISAFIGLSWVGLYSNYVLIINTVTTLLTQMLNSITASVGNLIATENVEKSYNTFKKIFFINFVITQFCSVCFIALLNPFISIWLGKKYLLNSDIVVLIVVNFFIIQMRRPAIIFIDAYGFYWQIKWKSIVEAGVNLIASLVFIKVFKMGIAGVLLGTFVSNVTTNLWWEPFVIYKYGFKKKLDKYFFQYLKCSIIGIAAMVLTLFLASKVSYIGISELIIKGIICLIVPNIIVVLTLHKTVEFKYFCRLFLESRKNS